MAKEDYTTYTELDPNNRYQNIVANSFDVVGLTRNEFAAIYKDFGVGFFGDLPDGVIHDELVTASSSVTANLYSMGFSNNIADVRAHDINNFNSIWVGIQITGGGQRLLFLISINGAVFTSDFVFIGAFGTQYYRTFTRSAGTIISKIYLDSARTNLFDTLTLTGAPVNTFRYFYVANSFDNGKTTNITGVIANHEILSAGVLTNPLKSAIFGERGVLAA